MVGLNQVGGDGDRRPGHTGIYCLCFCSKAHDVNVDPEQLLHQLGYEGLSLTRQHFLFAAKSIQLRAKVLKIDVVRLAEQSLPIIAELNDGEFLVVLGVSGEYFVTLNPAESISPKFVTKKDFEAKFTGNVFALTRQYSLSDDKQPFGIRWLIAVVLRYKKPLSHILIATLLIQAFGLAMPLFSQVILDKVLAHRSLATLHVLGLGMTILVVFEAIFSILKTQLLARTANKVDVLIGSRIIRHLLNLPLQYFESRGVGATVTRLNEIEYIRHFVTGAPISALVDALFVGVFLAVLFWYSPQLTLIVLASLPLLTILTLGTTPIMRTRLEARNKAAADNHSFLIDAISGAHTVKTFALEPVIARRWVQGTAATLSSSYHVTNVSGTSGAINQLIQRVTSLAVLWYGATLVMGGDLTMGQLIAFQMLTLRVVHPLVRLAQLLQEFQRFSLSMKELIDVMSHPMEGARLSGRHKMARLKPDIFLKNVTFRYSQKLPAAISNVSLEIRSGQMVGIVGRSGSGKSTLAKLLQRLYMPTDGQVEIGGMDIRHFDSSWLRKQFGVVLQENTVFNNSILENLLMHAQNAPMGAVVAAAKAADIHDFITSLPEGYDTQIGAGGMQLSGGQKQRLAIARALVSNPEILILDEASSALDYETEARVNANLLKARTGKTTITIAHRLSTIRLADKIFVMDKGEVVESGTHQELFLKNGHYSSLLKQQPEIHVSQSA
ncbi:peptidase domain-containing ABC transporter [Denitratisoma sp. agr-D3]